MEENKGVETPSMADKSPKMTNGHKHTAYIVAIVVLAILTIAGIATSVVFVCKNHQSQEKMAELETKLDQAGVVVDDDVDDEETTNTEGENQEVIEPVGTTAQGLVWTWDKYLNKNGQIDIISDVDDNEAFDIVLSHNLNTNTVTLSIRANWPVYTGNGVNEYRFVDLKVEGIDVNQIATAVQGAFGHDISGLMFLFLMKDGTVWYANPRQAINDNTLKAKKLGGVDGIIRLVSVNVSASESGGGGKSMLAQKADGSFYDLYDVLNAAGAWN